MSLGIHLCWVAYSSNNFTVTSNLFHGEKVRAFIKKAQNMPEKGYCLGWLTNISLDDLFNESQNFIVDDVLTLEIQVTIVNRPTFANIY